MHLRSSMKAAGALAIVLGLTGAALAESHVDPAIAGAIKARQSHMQLYAHNLGVLGAMAQGNMEYNSEMAAAAASNLAALTQLDQRSYWPPGSDNSAVEGTRALPAIWEDFPGVMEDINAVSAAAADMNGAAGESLEALQANMQALGRACGACHRDYRQRDE